ncbi:hypothetical protein CARUB_v10027455mg [Capsella rubella]|uniref:Transmembrane protein n=1 Tax=Capsella rubella TaxID=81985 RepID=R0GC99_9BRAS|nr:uncharacterized protein LOC17874900 [Capsella rubella]EOA14289.1 hypothetical protein CARUB_v10027455mg [Capsella rubella]
MAKNLGIVFLLLLVLLVSCSINFDLASAQPQKLPPQIEWRRMMITVRSSTSQRARKRDLPPSPSPSSPDSPPWSSSSPAPGFEDNGS